jgi:hypothetical protein
MPRPPARQAGVSTMDGATAASLARATSSTAPASAGRPTTHHPVLLAGCKPLLFFSFMRCAGMDRTETGFRPEFRIAIASSIECSTRRAGRPAASTRRCTSLSPPRPRVAVVGEQDRKAGCGGGGRPDRRRISDTSARAYRRMPACPARVHV